MSVQVFSQERLMQVLLMPQVSEKATYIVEKNNQVIFRVVQDATKAEIRAAVELMWKTQKIEVTGVQVANVKGKGKKVWSFYGASSKLEKGLCQDKSRPGN